jgi:predicted  nucleic acid-binding Zn-ribbon protein
MAKTKRAQNQCKTCSYTWHPRGKSLSAKCPKCGGTDVGYAKGGAVLAALIIAGVAIFGGDKHPEPASSANATAVVAASNEPMTLVDSDTDKVNKEGDVLGASAGDGAEQQVQPANEPAGADPCKEDQMTASCAATAPCQQENSAEGACASKATPPNELF